MISDNLADIVMATAGIAGSLGYLLAWRVHGKRQPTVDEVSAYMERKVAMDEMEAQEHRLRTIALRANRIAMPNPNSGPPARISRMAVTRGGRETFFQQK